MSLNLLHGSRSYAVITILSRFLSIISITIITRILAPSEYGQLSLIVALASLLNIVFTCEISQSAAFFYNEEKYEKKDLFGTALIFIILIYGVTLFVLYLGNSLFQSFYEPSTKVSNEIVLATILLSACNGVFLLIQNQLRMAGDIKRYTLLSIGFLAANVFTPIAFCFLINKSALGAIWGQIFGSALINIISTTILASNFLGKFRFKYLSTMLKYSLPIVPASLLLIFSQQSSKLMLGAYSDLKDVGIFSLAFQIAGFAAMSVLGVQTSITPAILANKSNIQLVQQLSFVFRKFALTAIAVCALLTIFSNEIIVLFSAENYIEAAAYVPFLSIGIVLSCFYVFFPGFFIKGLSKLQLITSFVSFLVGIGLNYLLIPIFGIAGAVAATMISSFSFISIWYYFSQKYLFIYVNWVDLIAKGGVISIYALVGFKFNFEVGVVTTILLKNLYATPIIVYLVHLHVRNT